MGLKATHPIVVDLPNLPFPMKEIYRRIGMPEHKVAEHEGVSEMLEKALEIAEPLIQPRAIYRFLPIQTISDNTVRFINVPFTIGSRQVAKLLGSCSNAVVFMSTIGKALEQQSHEMFQEGDVTLAFLLDAIASETADAAADFLHRRIIPSLVKEQGYQVTARFSPGYGDWPITVQSDVLQICEGGRIDISVTESSLMIPRKSVSAVFGLKRIQKKTKD